MSNNKIRWPVVLAALLFLGPSFAVRTLAQARAAEMGEAALLVGDVAFSPADAIRRYDGRGTLIDNIIPTGRAGLTVTCCMTFGPDENLYVSSPMSSEVLRFNGVTGAFKDRFIPKGSGGLVAPLILLFRNGYLYVGDTGAGAIRRYDATTGAYVDNFIPDNSEGIGVIFGDLQHFAFGPDNNLYVAAEMSKRVLRYDGQTGAYLGDFVPSSEGFNAGGLTFGPDGMMYVGSYPIGEVRRYDLHTGNYDLFIPAGGTLKPFGPVGLVFGPDGDFYVASVGSSEILRYDGKTGQFLGAFVPAGLGGLTGPRVITWKITTTVCHQPRGKSAKNRTLTIGYLSARDHLRHGDTLGPCQ